MDALTISLPGQYLYTATRVLRSALTPYLCLALNGISTTEATGYADKSFLKELRHHFGYSLHFGDNTSCISHASQLGTTDIHIHLKYSFVESLTHEGRVQLVYIRTAEMLADISTKQLPFPYFEYLRDRLMGAIGTDI